MRRIAASATIEAAAVTDELLLSPELVLVAPLDLARQARAALPDPPALPARTGLVVGRGEIPRWQ